MWVRAYRDGEHEGKLRPGQVMVHDGDVRTYVFNLSGLGKGVVKEFLGWAEFEFNRDNHVTEITGTYPRFQAEYTEE